MTDLKSLDQDQIKALEQACYCAFRVFAKTPIRNEDFDGAMALITDAGFTVEDQFDAIEIIEAIEDEIDARKAPVEPAATQPKMQKDIAIALQAAADRACHVNQAGATKKQVWCLAGLLVERGLDADYCDCKITNMSAILTRGRASNLIADLAR